MEKEYSQPVPNMRVVICNVTIPQALEYKKQIEQVEGVEEVNWLDDAVDIYELMQNRHIIQFEILLCLHNTV